MSRQILLVALIPIVLLIYYRLSARLQNYFLLVLFVIVLTLSSLKIALGIFISLFICLTSIYTSNRTQGRFRSAVLFTSILLQVLVVFGFRNYGGATTWGITYISLMLIGLALDQYWRRHQIQIDLPLFAATTFFPILPMGPIEHLASFKKKFMAYRSFDTAQLQKAFFRVLIGVFKILCIANPLKKYTFHESDLAQIVFGPWLFLYCFLAFIKLYAEFSGFIDVVRGTALLLGIETSNNFDRPYLSQNPIEVWQRWHISLTRWLRDYVYFPLLTRTKSVVISWLIVIFLVGLWHGGQIDYLYWGSYWALITILYIKMKPFLKGLKINNNVQINRALMIVIMSISTLCFMAAVSGWPSVLKRAFVWKSFDDLNFILSKFGESNSTIFALFCFLVLLCVEHFCKFIKYFWPLLVILTLVFADLQGTFFFYLEI